jgi:hypothetical protein
VIDPHWAGVASEFPDTNQYHPPKDFGAIATALRDTRPLEFRVMNGSVDSIDSAAAMTLKGAEARGTITMGYVFGPWNIDHFLALYSPKEGRIPEVDFETNGPPLTAKAAEDAVIKLHAAWGVWPVFYCGYYPWVAVGQPTGTALENCLWLPPRYSNVPPQRPRGLGSAFGWQDNDGTDRYPRPAGAHITFPGIGSCDMNTMNISVAELHALANGGTVALDPVADKATFKTMLDDVFGTPSEAYWERFLIGLGDGAQGRPDRRQSDTLPEGIKPPYGAGYDFSQRSGGDLTKHHHEGGTTGDAVAG